MHWNSSSRIQIVIEMETRAVWHGRDTGLVHELESFSIGDIGEDECAQGNEGVTEKVQQQDQTARLVYHLLLIHGLTFSSNRSLFLEYNNILALLLQASCCC